MPAGTMRRLLGGGEQTGVRAGKRFWAILIPAFALAFLAAACSSDTPDELPPPTAIPATAIPATATAAPSSAAAPAGTGLTIGLPEYDFGTALGNAYWYSRYTLGSLVMMSGLGVTFQPPMEAMMGMVAAVDQGPPDGEHVRMPANAALLRAVYAGGDPQIAATFNGDAMDLSNYRWDPEKADTTLTPSAQAQTLIKEIEWARFFNTPGWSGPVTSEFGAMDRFKGMMMYAGASQIARFALDNLRNDDGLFVAASVFEDGRARVVDDAVLPADQYQMLQALSDLRILLSDPDRYNGLYNNPELLSGLVSETDALFTRVKALEPAGIQDLDLAAQAAVWYAVATDDPALQGQALEMLTDVGDALADQTPDGVIDQARAARGLWEAARLIGDDRYADAAARNVTAMLDAYNVSKGYFEGKTTLKDWEIGDILGALNSTVVNGSKLVDSARVQQVYAGFFEATVNIGGLLQARIPKKMEASPFELARMTDDLMFAYPTIPVPPMAGGPNGTAAVHASQLKFNAEAGKWEVADRRFDTAAAMHTSNEMLWTFGLVSGFPNIDRIAALDFPTIAPAAEPS